MQNGITDFTYFIFHSLLFMSFCALLIIRVFKHLLLKKREEFLNILSQTGSLSSNNLVSGFLFSVVLEACLGNSLFVFKKISVLYKNVSQMVTTS